MASCSSANPAYYLDKNSYENNFFVRENLFSGRLRIAKNLYRKDLFGHYGCVNAIEFSNDGVLLVSGGDDRRVLLWSISEAMQGVGKPIAMRAPHISNIFCLGFDSVNSKILSAGNDDQVIVHDLRTGSPLDFFVHKRPVYGICLNPMDDNVFASAGDDGRVLIFDLRQPSTAEPLCLAKYKSAFHAVMYNPVDSRLLATANSKEGITLWDVRKPRQPLLRYGSDCMQAGMSVRWNSQGTRLLALRRRLPPVLYAIDRTEHLCQFYHSGYYNSCTMKSCSFAGNNDEYVMSGSDDFSLYMWKINESEFETEDWESSAHIVLTGHRSIVNQVRYCPQHCVIASSGVEKMVKLWCPFEMEGWKGNLDKEVQPENQRDVFSHEEYISLVQRSGQFMSHDYSHQSTQEDSRMMAFFDSLVQREIEGWLTDRNSSNSDESDLEPRSDTDSESVPSPPSSPEPSQHALRAVASQIVPGSNQMNRIAQLIAQKRPQLVKLAQRRSKPTRQRFESRTKRPKLKSIIKKVRKDRKQSSSNSRLSRKTRSGKQSKLSQSSSHLNHSVPGSRKRYHDSIRSSKRKFNIICNNSCVMRESHSSDQASSLDMPSTSSGITASSASSSVYRVIEQDSDDEQPSSNSRRADCDSNSNSMAGSAEPPLINILPTPLNGSHDMYINVLHVPENNEDIPSTSYQRGDDISSHDSDSSSVDSISVLDTPIVKHHTDDASTPDSGIVTGACSSTGSAFSSCTNARNSMCSTSNGSQLGNVDEGSDEDWMVFEQFKSRVKKARRNYRNHIGGDSDSN